MSIHVQPQWKKEREEMKQKKQSDHEKILKEVQKEVSKFKESLQQKEEEYANLLSDMANSVNQFNQLVAQQRQRYAKEVESWQLEKAEVDKLRQQEKLRLQKTNELLELAKAKEYQTWQAGEREKKIRYLELMLGLNQLPPKDRAYLEKVGVVKDGVYVTPLPPLEEIIDVSGLDPQLVERWRKVMEKQRAKVKPND